MWMSLAGKWRVYSEGEQLFGMPVTNYMELEVSHTQRLRPNAAGWP